MGENIGAAARAMWNFGLDRMRLVSPRDGWPNPRAEAMASGAARVLDRVSVFEDTNAACADLSFVFATTARERALTRTVMTPARAMAEARAMIAAGEKVGVLFGPERAGLENADIVRSNAVITVPVNPEFASLNLGQTALLVAYEWMRAADETAPATYALAGASRATRIEVDRFLEHLVARLDAVGFFFPEHKRDSMIVNLENLFRRAPLTDVDIRTLHGIVRALAVKVPGRK
ncbi:RNA methyltransferase [Amaricoccus solimangrovi]|uniref:RNA methyltransferase n=2 Tax=Amaricoccus solimangrovi TaxID=2589815 RepID=A0A501WW13_9RHOB|nr:RNA methyltransferase [Amaricoccus solimangrovi]